MPSRILVAVRVAATPGRTFQAFTREVGQWWRPNGLFRFTSRVTVEHLGWDTVPSDHVARHRFPDAVFLRRHGEWWQSLLRSLGQVLEMDRGRR